MKTTKQQLLQELKEKWGRIEKSMTGHISGKKIWDVSHNDEDEASYVFVEDTLAQFLSDCIDKVEKETIKKISSLIEKSRGNDYHNIGIGELDYHEKCAVDAYVITLQSRMKKLKSQKGDR